VCCSVLQCVAVCCSVLQCVAVCCSVLQCVAVYTINSNVLSSRLSVRDLRWSYSHFLVRCCPTFPHYLHLPRIRWEVALSCPSILSRLCSLHATLRYTHSDAHAQVHYAHCLCVVHCAMYNQLQIGWHRILRIFLKSFNLVPGVPRFSWDLSLVPCYHVVLIANTTGRNVVTVRLKSFSNNLEILCHPICNWLYLCACAVYIALCPFAINMYLNRYINIYLNKYIE